MEESANFLENAVLAGGFGSLDALAKATGYKPRTLARVRSGEVPLSKFVRNAVTKAVLMRNDAPSECIVREGPPNLEKMESKNDGNLARNLAASIQDFPNTPHAFAAAAWHQTERLWREFEREFKPKNL